MLAAHRFIASQRVAFNPTVVATENFNRTNFTYLDGLTTTTGGQTWSKYTGGGRGFDSNGLFCQSNVGRCDLASSTSAGADVVKGVGAADIAQQFTVKSVGGSGALEEIGFLVRASATEYLRIYWSVKEAKFRAFDYYGGLEHSAATDVAGSVSVNDVLSVEAVGSTVTLKQNGTAVLVCTGVHSTTNTWHGIYLGEGSSSAFTPFPTVDDWSISA